MNAIRVAFVTASLSRHGAGVAAAVESLSAAVAARGLDVRVFGSNDPLWEESGPGTWKGAEALVLPSFGPASFGYVPRLVTELRKWNPDIVHTHGLWMHHSRSVLQWARQTAKPVVVSPHGMLAPRALAFSPGKKRLSRWLYQDSALRQARVLHATSAAEAEEIVGFGLKQPIAVIPNGIDPSEDEPAQLSGDADRPRVISIGRVHPIKALDQLVKAWAMIEPDFSGWDLKIVGPSELGYADQLQDLAKSLNLRNVEISGAVFGGQKIDLLRRAELFALPSLTENFALTVAESLSCGTPVISTKGAPWAGLVAHGCGWWIDHGVDAMATTLRSAMSLSADERRAMGARGREWMARDFGWDKIGRQTASVYRWLVEENTDRPECFYKRDQGK
ncbi:glycosyltransferase [Mesorhizobium shangrilense]|uniref:Glycosyltransferase n=1 Tax=Mesorhizobium shangrilense TaxID=460060 RepID=A0ABV2DCN4_9HYPH